MPRLFGTAPALIFGLLALAPRAATADVFAFHHEAVMGTSLELRASARSRPDARRAEARALAEVDRLAALLSRYDPASEFSRWAAAPAGPVKVSPELFDVLAAADRWRRATAGAFDPRAAALAELWRGCEARGRGPTGAEVDAARARMAGPAWRLDVAAGTAERLGRCPLTLDGLAKGYIVGRACAAALDPAGGVTGVMLNAGGDLRAVGDLAQEVAVADPHHDSETSSPLTRIAVHGRSVSTSGGSQRGYRVGGRWHSHVLDPGTGWPASGVASATVVSEDAAGADALATALNVLPVEAGLALADATPGVACLVVTADGRQARSKGWAEYEADRAEPVALAMLQTAETKKDEGNASWGDESELKVDFEINRPEAEKGRYRRPYVAIWVENKDGFPVRNLTLWISLGGSGPFQWLPDLKRWYLSDQARKKVDKTEMVITMARPTRPPGKYTVIWDGKDDHGKPTPPGEYTLCIDSAREHGTYQSMRTPITVGGEPFSRDLKEGVEIKAASVEYRRKAAAK